MNDMFEINGRVTTAICYAKVIEDEAIEQIRRMCDYDLTRGSKVRIMPDVHAGKGCTIGTTMTITDKICPNIVAKDIPSELQRKYWIKAGQVRNSEGRMIIPVEHEEEINQRLEERNSISFDDVLQNILNDIEINASIKKAFDVVVRSANDYCYYRNWDSFPIEALGQRNKERSMSHDIFIADINSLSALVEEATGRRLVPWRVALGDDRVVLGDFAEYIIEHWKKLTKRLEFMEAIKWAQDHQGQVFYLMEHSKDSLNAKIQLMNQFSFSKFQAQAIIDMRVRLFPEDEKEKIENELQDLLEQINCFPEL